MVEDKPIKDEQAHTVTVPRATQSACSSHTSSWSTPSDEAMRTSSFMRASRGVMTTVLGISRQTTDRNDEMMDTEEDFFACCADGGCSTAKSSPDLSSEAAEVSKHVHMWTCDAALGWVLLCDEIGGKGGRGEGVLGGVLQLFGLSSAEKTSDAMTLLLCG